MGRFSEEQTCTLQRTIFEPKLYHFRTLWPIVASHLQRKFWDKTIQPYENGQFQKRYRRTCWGIVSTGRQTQETMDAKHLDYDMAQNAWWPRWFQQLQRTTCSNTASNYQQRNVATFPTRLYPGHRSYVELIYSSASRSSCTEGQRCCGEPTGMAPAFLS